MPTSSPETAAALSGNRDESYPPISDRLRLVLRLREEVKTYHEIGEVLGCTRQNVEVLYKRAKHLLEYRSHPLFGLPVRAFRVCQGEGLESREQIIEAIKEGRLHPDKVNRRNYGWKSYLEIHQWLGLSEPRRTEPKRCPHCGGELSARVR